MAKLGLAALAVALVLLGRGRAAPVAADERPRGLTARDLVGMPVPESVDVSPDGRFAVFAVAAPDFERSRVDRDLYVVPLDGGAAPRRLTYTPTSDETRPRY